MGREESAVEVLGEIGMEGMNRQRETGARDRSQCDRQTNGRTRKCSNHSVFNRNRNSVRHLTAVLRVGWKRREGRENCRKRERALKESKDMDNANKCKIAMK